MSSGWKVARYNRDNFYASCPIVVCLLLNRSALVICMLVSLLYCILIGSLCLIMVPYGCVVGELIGCQRR